jgi:uncharacterized membrane protein YhaH (DUF805 family)
MAYTGSNGENIKLLRKTVTGVADFTGRSRRTEVAYYWIASAIVDVVLSFAASSVMSFRTSFLFSGVIKLTLMVPTFALFVRRLHDQNKSGICGLLLPLSLLLSIPRGLAEIHGDFAEIIAQNTTAMSMAADLCSIAVLVLSLWRGTHDVNRYGPDPRLDER